jgi:hypothetical protein
MKVTRRDLLVWGAGATAGLVFTPVPWKLLGDVSIWSQNWPWIPQPAHGPVEVKASICTLCPNGCGLSVRMAGGSPVGLAGMRTHPVSQGALCPLGFGAHQLLWHPARLRTVRHRGTATSWDEARAAFAKASSEGPVAVVDGFPGRAASSVFESFIQKRGGIYRVAFGSETRGLTPYETWTGVPADALGYDLEGAQTIVSFGAPLLDGWGTPGRFTRLWTERAAGQTDPQLRLIQVETSLSRTGARSWRRITIRPGSEAALAAGIARVLLEEKLVSARGPMPPLTVDESAQQVAIGADALRDLARTIAARLPAVAIATDDNPAVAALNIVLGAVGARGGIVQRSKATKPSISAEAELPRLRAVLIDSTVPWEFVPKTDAEVFRFAAWDGGSTRADWLLPAPAFLEELTDVPTAPTSAIATYAVAAGQVKPPAEMLSAAQFLQSIDPAVIPIESVIHARCQELFRARRGTVCGRESTPVAKIATVQKFEEQLRDGAVWIDEPQKFGALRCELREWPPKTAVPVTRTAQWRAPVLPPLATKLYEESSLQERLDGRNA